MLLTGATDIEWNTARTFTADITGMAAVNHPD
jgi:hypothetical protein